RSCVPKAGLGLNSSFSAASALSDYFQAQGAQIFRRRQRRERRSQDSLKSELKMGTIGGRFYYPEQLNSVWSSSATGSHFAKVHSKYGSYKPSPPGQLPQPPAQFLRPTTRHAKRTQGRQS